MTIWTVTDRVTFDPAAAYGSLGVCPAHRFPSDAAVGHLEEIETLTAEIVEHFRLRDVPIYFQLLLGEKGIRVNEIACRIGGAYEDKSIPSVTGVDVLGVQLDWYLRAIGATDTTGAADLSPENRARSGAAPGANSIAPPVPPAPSAPPPAPSAPPPAPPPVPPAPLVPSAPPPVPPAPLVPSAPPAPPVPSAPPVPPAWSDRCRSASDLSRAFAVPLMFARPGVVHRLLGAEDMRRLPGVEECRFLLPEGTTIQPMANSTQRIACAVLHGPDARAVNELVDALFDTLRVEDRSGKNLLIDTREETKLPIR